MQRPNMTTETVQAVPLNFFILVLGAGFLLLLFCLILCCYFFRLKQQEQYRRRGYKKASPFLRDLLRKNLNKHFFLSEIRGGVKEQIKEISLVGQVCAVCLEEFKLTEELGLCPCTHVFHTKCLMKWLEVRNSCPMCNTTISVPRPSLEQM